ncbi:RDD family protein [Coralloluteibacterium stylophorae]|uniref:RDD family protein n=1 Tax=Coralloluteibacterium stylophorae TaxID=1776034 RepID=A0A8J8B0E7_9GAMM|nr:RDD family protein [Coralloluteibacterium stylophorae]MBS7457789.1 RDD family protein [Coralloluteibacterium stylophorae]
MHAPVSPAARPAHLLLRLCALVYDLLPVLALWFVVSLIVYAAHGAEPVESDSLGGWIELALLVAVTGLYAVESWRRGGQTLGMRAWRLRVVAADGRPATRRALWIRYGVAIVSLGAGGLGLLWSLFERERRTWHDLASRTVMVRLPPPPRRDKARRP